MGAPRPRLWLDHASIAVPGLAEAVERLDHRLGLRATVSPAARDRHSRVYLDRSYLEVSVRSGQVGWEPTMCFLRFDDPDLLRRHLDRQGSSYRFGDYVGVDGTWDDVEVRVGSAVLPTLIRRTAPAEVARDWPPALVEPHRCGARTLAAVHMAVPSLDGAIAAYGRLLGPEELSTGDDGRAHVRFVSGEVVLHEGSPDRIVGLVLGVVSLAGTRDALGSLLTETSEGIAWLDPSETFGLRLGFAEPAV